jgi:hypothetical protein
MQEQARIKDVKNAYNYMVMPCFVQLSNALHSSGEEPEELEGAWLALVFEMGRRKIVTLSNFK